MINFKPILAMSLILIGFLFSISVVFLDIMGPKVPLPRKSISEILSPSDNLFSLSNEENSNISAAKKSAELYLNQENLTHGYSDLHFNTNLSDPDHGNFTFLSALCYGNSENNCIYRSAYMKSSDYGVTWKIGFLD